MDRLPMDQRIALELAYWEGLSGPEVATVLGVNANTVRSRLARARDALRAEIAALARADRR
jgi:RNA polymerase sigma-70 factor (ECF subfamily)